MKNKFIQIKPLLMFLMVVGVAIAGYKFLISKIQNQNRASLQEQRFERIKTLTENSLSSSGYPDEKSAQAARIEICQLTAPSATEQNNRVIAIRDFLNKPTVEVKYECSDAFYDTTNNRLVLARTETYSVGSNTFLVNPQTNHVVQANIKELDTASKVMSGKEIEEEAKNFITNHSVALGIIDLNQYTFETNQKGGNFFFSWKGAKHLVKLDPPAVTCSKDIAKDTKGIYYQGDGTPCYKTYEQMRQPIIQIALNQYGQLLNYANSFEGEVGREISF